MRILLTGAEGQLGQDLRSVLRAEEVIPLGHSELDICDAAAVQRELERRRPDCVINTAAYNRVDECEKNPQPAFEVNAVGVYALARAAAARDAVFVHFSTDYVFDGNQKTPYVESDRPRPQSIYALSKHAGELIVQQYCRKYFLIRTCGLYGEAGNRSKGGNFIQRILARARAGQPLRVVNDQILTPTNTAELAEKLRPLLASNRYGLYHMTNTGECSWYEFARELLRLASQEADLQPLSSAELGAPARRPNYSVLDNNAYRGAGFEEFRPWQAALADYLQKINVARV